MPKEYISTADVRLGEAPGKTHTKLISNFKTNYTPYTLRVHVKYIMIILNVEEIRNQLTNSCPLNSWIHRSLQKIKTALNTKVTGFLQTALNNGNGDIGHSAR